MFATNSLYASKPPGASGRTSPPWRAGPIKPGAVVGVRVVDAEDGDLVGPPHREPCRPSVAAVLYGLRKGLVLHRLDPDAWVQVVTSLAAEGMEYDGLVLVGLAEIEA